MTAAQLHRLLLAPELIVVDLVDRALDALRLALLAEHPLLADDTAADDDPPVQRRARLLLRRAHDLHVALKDYRRHAYRAMRLPPRDTLPF